MDRRGVNKLEGVMDKNEKSTTVDTVWWEKNSEIEHVRILDELKTGNFLVCLRELFAYLRYIKKEYLWLDDTLSSLLQNFEETEREAILKEWNNILYPN